MCPYCKSGNIYLKVYREGEVPEIGTQINLKPNEKYYRNIAKIVLCRDCKESHYLTIEYKNGEPHWYHRKKEEVEVA